MRVDYPKFDSSNPYGTVTCTECPFANEDGYVPPESPMAEVCDAFGSGREVCCPTAANYAEACKLAEEAPSAV